MGRCFAICGQLAADLFEHSGKKLPCVPQVSQDFVVSLADSVALDLTANVHACLELRCSGMSLNPFWHNLAHFLFGLNVSASSLGVMRYF